MIMKRFRRRNGGIAASFAALAAIALAAGCASKQPARAVAQGAGGHAAARGDHHVYVTSGRLPETCYHDLGEVSFKEPYFQSVIDADDSKTYARLRDLAQQQFGDDVDAVVDVVKHQNEVGTEVDVSGDAVRLQKGETAECAVRAAPAALDSMGAVAAGGMTGTLVGGLLSGQNSATGAMMGGYFGAATEAGILAVKHQQQRQAFQEDLTKQIASQAAEIASLKSELSELIQHQCDREELTAEQCDEQRTQMLSQIAPAPGANPNAGVVTKTAASANGAAASGAASSKTAAPDAGAPATDFEIQNQIQEQQETIDRLNAAISDMLHQQQGAP
jgi:polyhydroxyalkanoate synthesis regulator phasin